MDKGRLHRQFARPLSKLFETAISEATLWRSRFYFVGCLAKRDGPRRTTRHFAKKEAALLDAAYRGFFPPPEGGVEPEHIVFAISRERLRQIIAGVLMTRLVSFGRALKGFFPVSAVF